MKIQELGTNPDVIMKVLFVCGVWFLFVALVPHDPLMAGLGFLMVGLPALHWYAASPQSQRLGRYRKPVLGGAYAALWLAILLGLGWAAKGLLDATGS